MLTLSTKQLDEKAQCVFHRHEIDAATLSRVRRADRVRLGPIVPWWAPATIDPNIVLVSIWAVLLAAWAGTIASLAGIAPRPTSPPAT
jgi:hypothetical protein